MWQNCACVMVGGALGALLRYGVGMLCSDIRLGAVPVATLTVNLVGCFLLGLLSGWGANSGVLPRPLMLLLMVGFCGAFTTFSTFSSETIRLVEEGCVLQASLYVGISVVLGFLLFWGGKALAGG